MKSSSLYRCHIIGFLLLVVSGLCLFAPLTVHAKKKQRYDIVYLLSDDLERVLDYREELEAVLDEKVIKKLRVMGRKNEYALVFDGNISAEAVSRTLIEHADVLDLAGYDEPWAADDLIFHPLYNVSYGMGPNLEPLKRRYEAVYKILGPDIHKELFIEKTFHGNYKLIYQVRGNKRRVNRIAKRHARLLKKKRIATSITAENNNRIVYGESSLIDDKDQVEQVQPAPAKPKKETRPAARQPVAQKSEKQQQPAFSGRENVKMERSVELYIKGLRKKNALSKLESTSWMVYDLMQDKIVVDINGDKVFQTASMVKPFVALAFFHKVKQGKLAYGPVSRRKMTAMIQRSNNQATNWVLRQVGGPRNCEAILKKHYGHIFHNVNIVETIPPGGKTYKNTAIPSDYVRFLRALYRKELPYGAELRRLMALPGRDRLYHGTSVSKGTLVYNKTGSTARLCGDMGILVPKKKNGRRYAYIFVGIIQRDHRAPNYGRWMRSRSNIIRHVSTIVFNQLARLHNLR
ncbi:MAG: hypothetical protein CSA20_07850 [Deltaproteobacteria bacterium]|nr:MAG: hypothetical protein CSB23_04305 [Deltaproteobacteria bacterium]PIE72447.1 MAG: hypothetical protein CSA20_07850 [Deltaproteobacteria bacterium]